MQIKDVTKRRDDEVVIHYIDDDGNYQSLRAYPSDIIAWHRAAQHHAHLTPESLASSQAVVNASALEQSDGDTPPAQAQVA